MEDKIICTANIILKFVIKTALQKHFILIHTHSKAGAVQIKGVSQARREGGHGDAKRALRSCVRNALAARRAYEVV